MRYVPSGPFILVITVSWVHFINYPFDIFENQRSRILTWYTPWTRMKAYESVRKLLHFTLNFGSSHIYQRRRKKCQCWSHDLLNKILPGEKSLFFSKWASVVLFMAERRKCVKNYIRLCAKSQAPIRSIEDELAQPLPTPPHICIPL